MLYIYMYIRMWYLSLIFRLYNAHFWLWIVFEYLSAIIHVVILTGGDIQMLTTRIPDYDKYDSTIFDLPNTQSTVKVQSVGRMAESRTRGGERRGRDGGKLSREASDESPNEGHAVTFHMGGNDTESVIVHICTYNIDIEAMYI